MELLELLELYCELLIARFGLVELQSVAIYLLSEICDLIFVICSTRDPDPGVAEGVSAIIHAAPRTEVKGRTHQTHQIISKSNLAI